jgi:putative acetyltransferase
MLIRTESSNDALGIYTVHNEAFPTAAEARLVDALRRNRHLRVSLLAECGGEILGHVAFSPVRLEPAHNSLHILGLAPVAVREAHRRQGVAAALIERGLEACRNLNIDAIVVLGEPSYYRRFGFRRGVELGLANEYSVDEEFMALELRINSLSGVRALARYGPEFAEL